MTVHPNVCILNVKVGENLIKQMIVKHGNTKKKKKIIEIDFILSKKKKKASILIIYIAIVYK
jgi:hypothetical protein